MITILALLLLISPAAAQQPQECPSHKEMLATLEQQYQEFVVTSGIIDKPVPNAILEYTLSASGTWTVIVTNPETDKTCPIAAGHGGQMAKPGKPT